MLPSSFCVELNQRAFSYIPTLDGWRGLAILLVLLAHFSTFTFSAKHTWITFVGAHGVTLFFVLSGFLITTNLLRELDSSGTLDLKRFYWRRAVRLLPCAWLFLIVVFVLFHTLHSSLPAGETASCLLFYRNYYHNPNMADPTRHFWSLSIEEQFYLVWPATLLLLGRRRAPWLAGAAAVLFATYRYFHQAAYLSVDHDGYTEMHADALFVGCLAALLAGSKFVTWIVTHVPLVLLVCGLIVCPVIFYPLVPLSESTLIAILLLCTSARPSKISSVLEWAPLRFIGAISYSIYIWQQLFALWNCHLWNGIWWKIALVIPVSAVSYYGFERPIRAIGNQCWDKLSQWPNPTAVTS